MSKKEYLNESEVDKLIEEAGKGDDIAFAQLIENFSDYIYHLCNKHIESSGVPASFAAGIMDDLYVAGMMAVRDAIGNYNPGDVKFMTFASYYINPAISRELKFQKNIAGVKKDGKEEPMLLEVPDIGVPDKRGYNARRGVLQLVDALKKLTDEQHPVNKEDMKRILRAYRIVKYSNSTKTESRNTFSDMVDDAMSEDSSCIVKGDDGYYYDHLFADEDLDQLISMIYLTDLIDADRKNELVSKLISTASDFYKSPFWDGEKIRFNADAVHGISRDVAGNINKIQNAINVMGRIRFRFNRYNSKHKLEPTSDYIHELSPVHLVEYHDNYYCLGLKENDKRVWHYRVDLMSDIETVCEEQRPVHASNILWNPRKYLSEHMNMAYDEPRAIQMKIRNTDYTFIHDWFGDNFKKSIERCEEGYDIIIVKTSPSMIVHWALQYGPMVEILDSEVRKSIREEMKKLEKLYG